MSRVQLPSTIVNVRGKPFVTSDGKNLRVLAPMSGGIEFKTALLQVEELQKEHPEIEIATNMDYSKLLLASDAPDEKLSALDLFTAWGFPIVGVPQKDCWLGTTFERTYTQTGDVWVIDNIPESIRKETNTGISVIPLPGQITVEGNRIVIHAVEGDKSNLEILPEFEYGSGWRKEVSERHGMPMGRIISNIMKNDQLYLYVEQSGYLGPVARGYIGELMRRYVDLYIPPSFGLGVAIKTPAEGARAKK